MDEDLRWRPGAPQACHFASVIANNLSIGNPQVALCQPLEFEGRLPWAPQGLVDPPPRAKPAPVLGAVKQTTLDRACGPEPGPEMAGGAGKKMDHEEGGVLANELQPLANRGKVKPRIVGGVFVGPEGA